MGGDVLESEAKQFKDRHSKSDTRFSHISKENDFAHIPESISIRTNNYNLLESEEKNLIESLNSMRFDRFFFLYSLTDNQVLESFLFKPFIFSIFRTRIEHCD